MIKIKKFFLLVMLMFVINFLLLGIFLKHNGFYYVAIINFLVLLFGMLFFVNKDRKKIKIQKKSNFMKLFDITIKKGFFVFFLLVLIIFLVDKLYFSYFAWIIWIILGSFVVLMLFYFENLINNKIYIGKKIFFIKDFIFFLSLILSLVLFGIWGLKSSDIFADLTIIGLFSLIIFALFILFSRPLRGKKMWQLLYTKFLIFVIVISFLLFVPSYYMNAKKEWLKSDFPTFGLYVKNDFLKKFGIVPSGQSVLNDSDKVSSGTNINTGKLFYTGNGKVLKDSGIIANNGVNTGNQEKINILIGADSGLGNECEFYEKYFGTCDLNKKLNYGQILKYLIDINNIELSRNKNISFSYVSKYNELYPYYMTSYRKKLIGKNLNPTSLVKCENYLVMKGILQNWDDLPNKGDIFDKYFEKADELGVLNGCERGNILTISNL